jgi:hypothetical protein
MPGTSADAESQLYGMVAPADHRDIGDADLVGMNDSRRHIDNLLAARQRQRHVDLAGAEPATRNLERRPSDVAVEDPQL